MRACVCDNLPLAHCLVLAKIDIAHYKQGSSQKFSKRVHIFSIALTRRAALGCIKSKCTAIHTSKHICMFVKLYDS